MSHSFVWIDIPVLELDRAIAFYAAVLGRPVTREGGPGFLFGLIDHAGSDVAGCLCAPADDNQPSARGPLVYLNADGRLLDALAAATTHGGRVVEPMAKIGAHGWRAIVIDSEGNRIALHSPTA